MNNEMVNHPSHYNKGKYEVIDVIEDWGLGFSLGNAIKYIARCEHKGNKKQDLEKALFYINRYYERKITESIFEDGFNIYIDEVLIDWNLSSLLTLCIHYLYRHAIGLEHINIMTEIARLLKKELDKEE